MKIVGEVNQMCDCKAIAHHDSATGRKQFLDEHLLNVAKLAQQQAESIGLGKSAFLVGLLHDIGKADRKFQEKIQKNSRRKVNHSSAGARVLLNLLMEYSAVSSNELSENQKNNIGLFFEIYAYVITSHHGLYDIPTDNGSRIFFRLKYDEEVQYYFNDDVLSFLKNLENKYSLDCTELVSEALNEFVTIMKKLSDMSNSGDSEVEDAYYNALYVRLLSSILRQADILDTINSYSIQISPFSATELLAKKQTYVDKTEQLYATFQDSKTDINVIRTDIADQARERGIKDGPGIYRMNLPTGSGKTNLSLRYAVHQMLYQGRSRFIYVAPFLSILEQNAKHIKDVLDDEDILEHHSNIVESPSLADYGPSSDESELEGLNASMRSYLTESWDGLVILTTSVQFFNTLVKGKSANLRRFSSLINSVIILDEIQSYPVKTTYNFNLIFNFLKIVMNVNLVLCTATQPTLDTGALIHRISYGDCTGNNKELVEMSEKQRKIFNRNEYYLLEDGNEIGIESITDEILSFPEESFLVIVNTKKAAKLLFEDITASNSTSDRTIYYLSTNLCPKHRQLIIEQIRDDLSVEKPIVCVSTQLIEAGVDVDFSRVIRSYAGIDNIIQAAGRCNREGRRTRGIVYLANLANSVENVNRLEDIRNKKNRTKEILFPYKGSSGSLDIFSLVEPFYESFFSNLSEELCFPSAKDKGSLLDDLSINNYSYFPGNYLLHQSFARAAQQYDLIEDDQRGVIVPFKWIECCDEDGKEKTLDNTDLINALLETIELYEENFDSEYLYEIKKYLKLLQPYTVNVHHINLEIVAPFFDGQINILNSSNYDDKLGMTEDSNVSIL
jgi:CRISPR-associated endonuclease/helicase Cas3